MPCLEIEVTGASSQPDVNGNYRLDESFDQQCSGRQSWSSNVSPEETVFIYYLEDGYDGWVIGKFFFFSVIIYYLVRYFWHRRQFIGHWKSETIRVNAWWKEAKKNHIILSIVIYDIHVLCTKDISETYPGCINRHPRLPWVWSLPRCLQFRMRFGFYCDVDAAACDSRQSLDRKWVARNVCKCVRVAAPESVYSQASKLGIINRSTRADSQE